VLPLTKFGSKSDAVVPHTADVHRILITATAPSNGSAEKRGAIEWVGQLCVQGIGLRQRGGGL